MSQPHAGAVACSYAVFVALFYKPVLNSFFGGDATVWSTGRINQHNIIILQTLFLNVTGLLIWMFKRIF